MKGGTTTWVATQNGGCYTRLGWGRVVFEPWRILRVPVGQAWAGAGQRGRKRRKKKEKKRNKGLFYNSGSAYCERAFVAPWISLWPTSVPSRSQHQSVSQNTACVSPETQAVDLGLLATPFFLLDTHTQYCFCVLCTACTWSPGMPLAYFGSFARRFRDYTLSFELGHSVSFVLYVCVRPTY